MNLLASREEAFQPVGFTNVSPSFLSKKLFLVIIPSFPPSRFSDVRFPFPPLRFFRFPGGSANLRGIVFEGFLCQSLCHNTIFAHRTGPWNASWNPPHAMRPSQLSPLLRIPVPHPRLVHNLKQGLRGGFFFLHTQFLHTPLPFFSLTLRPPLLRPPTLHFFGLEKEEKEVLPFFKSVCIFSPPPLLPSPHFFRLFHKLSPQPVFEPSSSLHSHRFYAVTTRVME